MTILLFLVCLAVTLYAARTFAGRLDQLGTRFGFSEALVGLLTALAADGPEISSALFATAKGAHAVSVGVLVGSNAFNLAAMIGVSGLLAGCVTGPLNTLALEGGVAALVTMIAVALLLGWIAAGVAAVLAALVVVPYVIWVLTRPEHEPAEPVPGAVTEDPTHHLIGLIVIDVIVIIAGSFGMVQTALTLGHQWGIGAAVLGALLLGPLTSLPNALTGVRLGLADRGEALIGETFNSNTINLAIGVIVPSLFVALGVAGSTSQLELWWLVGMTAFTLVVLWRGGLRRWSAALLIGLYGGYVAIVLAGT